MGLVIAESGGEMGESGDDEWYLRGLDGAKRKCRNVRLWDEKRNP